MAIITDFDQARNYARISVVGDDARLPNMDRAGRRYLVPVLGLTLYEAVYDSPDTADADLLALCRAAVVPLAFYGELGANAAAWTDAGVRQQDSHGMPAAFRWQYMELQQSLMEQGQEALENLWTWLQEHGADVSWTDPTPGVKLFKDAADFNRYYTLDQPARVYRSLLPLVGQVLDLTVNETVGAEIVKTLSAGQPADGFGFGALDLLKKAVAHLVISEAVGRMPAKLTPQGFTVLLGFTSTTDQPYSGTQQAPDRQLSMLHTNCHNTGMAFLKKAKDYMQANADEAALADFKSGPYYIAPATEMEEDKNLTRTGIFGF